MSGLFQEVMYDLEIEQYTSSAYHTESKGALERFHQTLKNLIIGLTVWILRRTGTRVFHLLLFAAREAVQETLGFSPFELVCGVQLKVP